MSDSTGLKILFAGTPEFAAHHLSHLLNTRHQVVGVYTQPDRPAGRGKKLSPSPVKCVALQADLPVFQPPSLKSAEAQQQLAALDADIMVVVAYGLLLPQAVLSTPLLGCINVHASLLPRWRGAAPIQRAVEAGDNRSGVTIMQMDAGLDTGAMLAKAECIIAPTDTAGDLHDKLLAIGPNALVNTLNDLVAGKVVATVQDESLATYAHKLTKAEAELDWQQSAAVLSRRVRAFNPFPVAYSSINNERIKIYRVETCDIEHRQAPGTLLDNSKTLRVACGEGTALQLEQLQLPGKKVMTTRDVLNGSAQLFPLGARFSGPGTL